MPDMIFRPQHNTQQKHHCTSLDVAGSHQRGLPRHLVVLAQTDYLALGRETAAAHVVVGLCERRMRSETKTNVRSETGAKKRDM